jgi:hypothetical protein
LIEAPSSTQNREKARDPEMHLRYRGLAKNANRAYVMPAMIHLKIWGRPLTGEMRPT